MYLPLRHQLWLRVEVREPVDNKLYEKEVICVRLLQYDLTSYCLIFTRGKLLSRPATMDAYAQHIAIGAVYGCNGKYSKIYLLMESGRIHTFNFGNKIGARSQHVGGRKILEIGIIRWQTVRRCFDEKYTVTTSPSSILGQTRASNWGFHPVILDSIASRFISRVQRLKKKKHKAGRGHRRQTLWDHSKGKFRGTFIAVYRKFSSGTASTHFSRVEDVHLRSPGSIQPPPHASLFAPPAVTTLLEHAT
ncbi:hypothetical protein FIBSPDRAFT_897638 [Athelia psychrophila]|uniref:Uncharacterized protein n=1 Tax=Athelia psychrophila TaxID=1759441 RepID=A0A166BZI0_9AGAM|nr:hypothetical protein FIBSPDRAFT_897638 [Fibularhizoctonia sp. CBS 109695]